MLKLCSELSIAAVEADVQCYLDSKNFDAALEAVRDAVDSVINNQRSVARVYASFQLDQLCQQIAQSLLQEPWTQRPAGEPQGGTVILATELVAAGGHVEVIKDLVRLNGVAAPVHLLLTNNFNRINIDAHKGYAAAMQLPLTVAEGVTPFERIQSIIQFLQARRPENLVLLVHNQDAVGITAALLGLTDKVLYMHHGDHHLSLGVTCKAFQHFDLSNCLFCYCRQTLALQNNHYLPLTLSKEHTIKPRNSADFLQHGRLITASIGRPEKFDVPAYQYQYLDLIGVIIKASGGGHIHIGALNAQQLDRIHEGMNRLGIAPHQFKHIPWVDSVATALLENAVDLCIASFPHGGAKAQIEAMAVGIPLLFHENYRSPVLSGLAQAYPGPFTWANELHLSQVLQSMNLGLLQEHSMKARHHFESCHTNARFIQSLKESFTDESSVTMPHKYPLDGLQAFLDEEKEDGQVWGHELGQLRQQLHHQLDEAKRLHAELALRDKQMRDMGSRRRMLSALLTGRRLKPRQQ